MKKNALGRVQMKLFTKLALVSSIAVSANAMAMQAMDDASLSSTTGQDGINIGMIVRTRSDLDPLVPVIRHLHI